MPAGIFLVASIVGNVAPGAVGVMKDATEDWTFLILGVALLSAVAALAYLFLGTPRPSRLQLLTAATGMKQSRPFCYAAVASSTDDCVNLWGLSNKPAVGSPIDAPMSSKMATNRE